VVNYQICMTFQWSSKCKNPLSILPSKYRGCGVRDVHYKNTQHLHKLYYTCPLHPDLHPTLQLPHTVTGAAIVIGVIGVIGVSLWADNASDSDRGRDRDR
jgi:hypothetical protein